jgi:hypothetical protein
MPQVRLLHLDGSRLAAYRWRAGRLDAEGRFANDAAGHAAFAAYLDGTRRSAFHLLADVQDEGFIQELVPYVQGGGDRRALIERKLAQHYFGATLTAALSLGREKAGRRDERMLFMALTRQQLFDPWLAVLRAAEAQLAGIHSVPPVCRALVDKLALAQTRERLLLITLGEAGVRQTYFENGSLRFSRLSLAGSSVEEQAVACAAEPAKIHQYLVSQRMLSRGSALPTLLICHQDQRPVFAQRCRSTAEIEFEFLDLGSVATACGFKDIQADSSADRLLLHLLARDPPAVQFARAPERHLYRLSRARFALYSASAVVLFGCLLASVRHLVEIHALRQETRLILHESEHDARRYAQIMRELPPAPTSLENLRAVVARYESLERRSTPMEFLLLPLSRVLEAYREVRLDRIEWHLTNRLEEIGGAPLPVGAESRPESGMYAVALITCALSRTRADERRRILEEIEAFVAALKEDPRLRVSVVRLPLDVDPTKSLKSADESPGAADDPRFVLRLSYAL